MMKIMIGDSEAGTNITNGNNITYWINDGKGGIKAKGAGSENYNLKYDPTNAIPKLTMNGLLVKKSASHGGKMMARGMYIEGDLEIELVGENIVDISSSICNSDNFAIETSDSIKIIGEGSLVAKGGKSIERQSAGIRAHKDIIVNCNLLRAEGGESNNKFDGSFGIHTHYLTVEGGSVNALAGKSKAQSTGVFAGECIINSGKLTAQGGAGTNEYENKKSLYSMGMCIGIGGFTMNGGEVIAVGKPKGIRKYGLYISKEAELVINGGAITAIGETNAIGKAPVLNSENNYHISAGNDIASLLKISSSEEVTYVENKAVIIEEEQAHKYVLTTETPAGRTLTGNRTYICARCGAVKFETIK